MKTREKVGIFVVRQPLDRPPELLLFTHRDHPEAPIQIPGGSIECREMPEAALWRELNEEAGLSALPIIRKIGISEILWEEQLLRRHCYLLDGTGLPDFWEHEVSGSGVDQGLSFSFSWHLVDPTFVLSGDLGYFLRPEFIPELY